MKSTLAVTPGDVANPSVEFQQSILVRASSASPLHQASDLQTSTVLTRIYGKAALDNHSYSRTLSSLAFAGTIVGMLLFGTLISPAHSRMVRLKHLL